MKEKFICVWKNKFYIDERGKWILLGVVLCLIASIRYCYKILSYPSVYYDEVASFKVVLGFLDSGKLKLWDYAQGCVDMNSSYTRGWPYTLLLALWMKIFDTGLFTARMLSVSLGVLFIASYIYIIKKTVNNIVVALWGAIILILNTELTYVFRFVRMYCLWMVLTIWMFYFIFLALTKTNNFKHNNIFTRFIKQNLDFHLGYVCIAAVLGFFSFETHINTVITILGVGFFVLIKAITEREKRYINLLILGGTFAAIMLIAVYTPVLYKNIGVLELLHKRITYHGAFFKNIRLEYAKEQLNLFGNIGIAIILMSFAFIRCFFVKSKQNNFVIYCVTMCIIMIFFFVCLTDRYYKLRYIIFILPLTATLYAYSLSYFISKRNIVIYAMFGVLLFFSGYISNGESDYIRLYTRYDSSDYVKSYDKLLERIGEEKVGIATVRMNNSYLYENLLSKCNASYMDLERGNLDTWVEFAKENPHGYILTSINKYNAVATEEFRNFIRNWSDRVAGQEIDEDGVEISEYHAIFPSQNQTELIQDGNRISYTCRVENESALVSVQIKMDCLPENVKFVIIQVYDGEKWNHYQLMIPENADTVANYDFEVKVSKDTLEVLVSNYCCVYSDGTLTEMIQ